MKRYLRLRWPTLETSIRVELLDNLNPELVEAVWQAVPLYSIQSHAVVAGQQMYFPTRLILSKPEAAFTEPMNQQRLGRVNFEPFFQYISLNYGPMSEPVPAWPLGQVYEEDIPQLETLGKKIWENLLFSQTFLPVIVEDGDDEPAPASPSEATPAVFPTKATGVELPWTELLAFIEVETEAIWLVEPDDVKALRLGVLASEAGVSGQYFSPWVMVSGLVRSFAVVELAALTRLGNDSSFSVTHLKKLLQEMLSLQIGVLSYFGLSRLGATLEAVNRVVTQINDPSDFAKFIKTLFIYVNRYNLWLHQTFPWHLSTLFPKANPAEAQTVLNLSARLSDFEN